jgi:hypothetical protein
MVPKCPLCLLAYLSFVGIGFAEMNASLRGGTPLLAAFLLGLLLVRRARSQLRAGLPSVRERTVRLSRISAR